MTYPYIAALLWLTTLAAFVLSRPWRQRDLTRTVVSAVLCFTPAFAVYGFGGMFEILPLVLAVPSWLFMEGLPWSVAMVFAHLVPIVVVGFVALGLAVRADIGSDGATGTSVGSTSALDWKAINPASAAARLRGSTATTAARLYYATVLLVLPALTLISGFYPWHAYPLLLHPVPWPFSAVLLVVCGVLAHLLASAVLGPGIARCPTWKRILVAFLMFVLLRSFVAVVVFGVTLPEHHVGIHR